MARRINSGHQRLICTFGGQTASVMAEAINKWPNHEKQLPDPIGNPRSKH
ncbi:hypothetical protein PCH70_13180 [Pseudomonas cichorii JBC1]|nr:hypothetical protein PCH70_13180 [Pseudomonas cichorii JBC1]